MVAEMAVVVMAAGRAAAARAAAMAAAMAAATAAGKGVVVRVVVAMVVAMVAVVMAEAAMAVAMVAVAMAVARVEPRSPHPHSTGQHAARSMDRTGSPPRIRHSQRRASPVSSKPERTCTASHPLAQGRQTARLYTRLCQCFADSAWGSSAWQSASSSPSRRHRTGGHSRSCQRTRSCLPQWRKRKAASDARTHPMPTRTPHRGRSRCSD